MTHIGNKPTERSFYQPIISALENLSFTGVQELEDLSAKNVMDIIASKKGMQYIFEVKRERTRLSIIEGIMQAYRYSLKQDTNNIIIITYDQDSFDTIDSLQDINERALNNDVSILCLTENWIKYFQKITVTDFIGELNNKIEHDIHSEIDLDTVADALKELIKNASIISRKYFQEVNIQHVIGDVDAFLSLIESENRKDTNALQNYIISELVPYFIVNQILFYQIYAKTTQIIPPLNPDLDDINHVSSKFNFLVEHIDYEPIFHLKLINQFPSNNEVLELIRNIIRAIDILKPEYIDSDLLGRLFHYLLPKETRKSLAAFYTQVKPANLLSQLAIRRWDDTVWDPACGSGTLLVSAYKQKWYLYKRESGATIRKEKERELHRLFLQEQLTGSDIMAFATHLTAINLCSKHIDFTMKQLRLAWRDSLEYSKLIHTDEFRENPSMQRLDDELGNIKRYLRTLEDYNPDANHLSQSNKKMLDVSPFQLNKVNVILMNPPFTDRHRMPPHYRKKLEGFTKLTSKCGSEINLWGMFIALADELLEDNGIMAAIVPVNILRGKNTQILRDFLINNYYIKYIVKPVEDNAFSEGAKYRDIMVVLQKSITTKKSTGIILLKKPICSFSENEFNLIGKRILTTLEEETIEEDAIDLYWISNEDIRNHKDSLMPLIAFSSIKDRKSITGLLKILSNCKTVFSFDIEEIFEGIKVKKDGGKAYYITRNIDTSRVLKSFLMFDKENSHSIEVNVKKRDHSFRISKQSLLPLIRTIVGLRNIDMTGKWDYILKSPEVIQQQTGLLVKGEVVKYMENRINSDEKTNIAFPDKINLKSRNTKFIAVYSNLKVNISNALFGLRGYENDDLKIITLILNSSWTILQMLVFKSDSLGGYDQTRLSAHDWTKIKLLNPLTMKRTLREEFLQLFNKFNSIEVMQSIKDQLINGDIIRLELDILVAKGLGMRGRELNTKIKKMHDIIIKTLS